MLNLRQLVSLATKFTSDNSPLLLTALGVTGSLTTAYLTARATFEAAAVINAEQETTERFLTKKEKFKLVWPLYIAAVSTGVGSVTCIIMANRIGTRRTAAMAAAYTTLDKGFAEYRETIVEKMGASKERAARAEVAQKQMDKDPLSGNTMYVIKDGGVPCYDQWSGRYFLSSMEDIKKAVNDINYKIIHHNYASLNDFYDKLGLETTGDGEELGWTTNELFDVIFDTTMTDDQRPAIHMSFRSKPLRGYFKTH
jgi:hypothetical protein